MDSDFETSEADVPLPYIENAARQRRRRVLLLAGTAEARNLAVALSREPYLMMTVSLARPERMPFNYRRPVRIGGWGGEKAYRNWLIREGIDIVIDATHPFAEEMSKRTAKLASELGIEAVRFMRPQWMPTKDDNWTFLNVPEEAADHMAEDATVFLATGRRDLLRFSNLEPRRVLCRVRDMPETPIPFADGEYLVTRGALSIDDEIDLFDQHKVDWVVTRNSGGPGGWPKLEAARVLGLPVAVLRRPPPADMLRISTVAETLNWVRRRK
ncbi:MAG: cobalt-precorrin-6A reductase [Boseongicola sp.]|nr:cobalt-precorrin-6A reductase [Boseongicola sp.]